ncbi:hypothetical protein, partial [Priestia megaterium]|uniref:hypothetical protein n=1 Tax=Priestia megaterium TaxID=1404 RepID=UPI00300041E2
SGGILFISSVMGGIASIVIGKKMNIKNVKNFYKIGLYIFFIGYLIIIFGSKTAIVCISVSICCFVAFSFVQMALNYLLDSVLKESKKIYIGIFNLCNFIGMSIGVALFSKLIVVFNMNICFVFLLVAVIIKACMSNSISAVNNKTKGYDYEC